MEKRFILTLLDGTDVVLKAPSYELLLNEIDNFILKYNECVTYYAGYDDEEVINLAKEEDIEVEKFEL